MYTVYLKDFCLFPAGRRLQDGAYSGERFRLNHIAPALKGHDQVTVDLTGTLGLAVSFLRGAFTDLGFPASELRKRLTIKGGVPSDSMIAWEIIYGKSEDNSARS